MPKSIIVLIICAWSAVAVCAGIYIHHRVTTIEQRVGYWLPEIQPEGKK